MSSLLKKFFLFTSFIGGVLYPSQAWSEDCVTCSVQKDIATPMAGATRNLFDITIDMVACTDPEANFDRIVCDAVHYAKTYEELQGWIKKCHKYDPNKRSSILEYYKTVECKSDVFEASDFHDKKHDFTSHVAPLASFNLWENQGFSGVINSFEALRKYYWEQDKKNKDKNYTSLREFAKVLRKPDANGLSFLDHVVLNWTDQDCADVGLGSINVRNQLIKKMCGIGVTFALEDLKKKYPCKSNPKYAGF